MEKQTTLTLQDIQYLKYAVMAKGVNGKPDFVIALFTLKSRAQMMSDELDLCYVKRIEYEN